MMSDQGDWGRSREIGDALENLTKWDGAEGDGLFSDLQKHPFFMVKTCKSKINIESFKFFVSRFQIFQ